MRWCDLDLAAGTWKIHRSFEQVGRELKIRPCKNAASRRVINLGPALVAHLKEHKAAQATRLLAQGRRVKLEDLVFDDGAGNAVSSNTVSANWGKALNRLDCTPRVKFHSLRHLHASLAIAAGVDVLSLSRRLGHADVKTTIDIYGHLIPSTDIGAANAVDAMLAGGGRASPPPSA